MVIYFALLPVRCLIGGQTISKSHDLARNVMSIETKMFYKPAGNFFARPPTHKVDDLFMNQAELPGSTDHGPHW